MSPSLSPSAGEPEVPDRLPVRMLDGDLVVEVAVAPGGPGSRIVFVDGLPSSQLDLEDPARLPLPYLEHLAAATEAALERPADGRVLHLGGGGFALPIALDERHPGIRQEAYELSGVLVAVARRHLGAAGRERLTLRAGDARDLLAEQPDASADAVVTDAFVGIDPPAQLVSATFLRDVRRVLRAGGVYVLNTVDGPPWEHLAALTATLDDAFGRVAALGDDAAARGAGPGNLVLVAGDDDAPGRIAAAAATATGATAVDPARLAGLIGRARPLQEGDPVPSPLGSAAVEQARQAREAALARVQGGSAG